ncbi:MAG: hypothetical protein M9938_06610 [Solirubrobacterales bacterium]|nr:hypothetical protein [Solirubrobacterales bacterium]
MNNRSIKGSSRRLRAFLAALFLALLVSFGAAPASSLAADETPPTLSPLAQPADFTKAVNNTVIFQADEQVTGFECRTVDNTGSDTNGFATGSDPAAGFTPCNPGQFLPTQGWNTINGQTDGRKGLQVRGTDLAGNTQETDDEVLNNGGLTVYWTVDNTAPTASFQAGTVQQGSNTTSTDATINVSAADTPIDFGVAANGIAAQDPAYECSLDNAPFAACAPPISLTGLTAGAKSFRVRVTDEATNVSSIIERTWTVVDTGNASVTLDTQPAAVIGSRDAAYTFSPDNGTAECRIDATEAQNAADTGWSACSSPHTFTGLAEGNHQAEIRENPSAIPAVDNFAVYADLPSVTIDQRPGLLRPDGKRYTGLTEDSDQILFSSADNPPYAPGATTFECRYYRVGDLAGPWEACSSPYAATWDKHDDLAEMKFEVRPTSSTGNLGSAQNTAWTIMGSQPVASFGVNGNDVIACGNGAENGPGPSGCDDTADSTQPWTRTRVELPQFKATSSRPIDGLVGFACQLNDGTVHNPCTERTTGLPAGGSPLTVVAGGTRGDNDNLGDEINRNAANTFKVWVIDPAGNMSDPVSYTFTHDTVQPTFAITSATPARTNLGTNGDPLVVDLESDGPLDAIGARCMLIPGGDASTDATSPGDSGTDPASSTWPACTSQGDATHAQWVGDSLVEGTYALDIRGYDEVWNVASGTDALTRPSVTDNDPNGRRYVFTVDRTAPTVSIDSGPAEASTVPATSGTFGFTPSEPGAQIDKTECRLDPADPNDHSGGWSDCDDGSFDFSGLTDGAHVFQVRSLDTAGNQGLPETRNWTVDSTLPSADVTIDPSAALTKQTAAELTFTLDPNGSTAVCRISQSPAGWTDPHSKITGIAYDINTPEPITDWVACSSPVDLSGLADGGYTVDVKPINYLDTPGPVVSKSWTVDTVKPVATITDKPAVNTRQTSAELKFTADKAGSTFECEFDGGPAQACTSPQNFSGLSDGSHTFTVTPTDPIGNVGDPVSHTWNVDTVLPNTSIDSGPTGTVNVPTATLEFSADKAGSTFECKLGNGSWGACSSPKAYTGLTDGDKTFAVKATDPVGNTGPITIQTWTVDLPKCAPGQTGTPPDCQDPVCPPGKVGTPPNCQDPVCPPDKVGTPPNCQDPVCPPDKVGTYPDCYPPCPSGTIGTPPLCHEPPPAVCPSGQIGTPPNCVTPKAIFAKPKVKAPKRVKAGKKFKARVSVKNIGNASATGIKVCVKAPKRLVTGKCGKITKVDAGRTGTVVLQLRGTRVKLFKKNEQATYTITVSAAGVKKKTYVGHVTLLK